MVEALEVAAVIAGCRDTDELYESLCAHSRRSIHADWACLTDAQGRPIAQSGTRPVEALPNEAVPNDAVPAGVRPVDVLTAELVDGRLQRPAHVMWMPLPSSGASLVLGRSCSAFEAEERQTAAALARIADSLSSRIREQQCLRSVLCHPSNGLSEVSLYVE